MSLGGTPLNETIVRQIEGVLRSIDGTGQWNQKIESVVDFEAWDDDLVMPAAMVLQLSSDEDDGLFSDRQMVEFNFQIVACLSKWTDARLAANRLVADIKRALLSDVTLGGYARSTRITRVEWFQYDQDEGGRAGATLFGTVQYRHLRADPYTQG